MVVGQQSLLVGQIEEALGLCCHLAVDTEVEEVLDWEFQYPLAD